MRTIKFKAKRVDNGEWVFGDLFRTHDDHHSPSTSIFTTEYSGNSYGSRQRHEIDPETVCQFTGFLYKNEVELYEGDILQNDSFKYEVVFVDGGFKLNHLDRILGLWGDLQGIFKPDMEDILDITDLTGNIHDK